MRIKMRSAALTQIRCASDGSWRFDAAAGKRAHFDLERKIRTGLSGLTRVEKGQAMVLSGGFARDPSTVVVGADWRSIIQIHQADTKRADGICVNASPMFSLDMLPDPRTGKPFLQMPGKTGRGEQANHSPMSILGKLSDVEARKDHTFEMCIVDGHGGIGQVSVWIDGVALVDRCDIPTGYEYAGICEDAFLIQGASQPTCCCIELGIYAGEVFGDAIPPARRLY